MKHNLEVFGRCYSSGCFEELEPLLAENCKMDSFWVLESLRGKAAIYEYLSAKGKTLKAHNRCPHCTVVELSFWGFGSNASRPPEEGVIRAANCFIWHEDDDLALLMEHPEMDSALVLLKLDEAGLIKKIDYTSPNLFQFSPLCPVE